MSGHIDRNDSRDQNKEGKTKVSTGVQHPGRSTFQEMRSRIEQQQHFQGFSYQKGNEYRRQRQVMEKLTENQAVTRVQPQPQQNLLNSENANNNATKRSQSDTTPVYENVDTTIRPPQFRKLVCEKICQNQKNEDDTDIHQSSPQRLQKQCQRLPCEEITQPTAEQNLRMADRRENRQLYITNKDDKDDQISPVRSTQFLKLVNDKLAQNHLKNIDVMAKQKLSKSHTTGVADSADMVRPALPLKSRSFSKNLLENEEKAVPMASHQVGLDHVDPPYDFPLPQHRKQKNTKDMTAHREISNPIPIEDTVPHIRPPEFRPLPCGKLVQNQKNEDIMTPHQRNKLHISRPTIIEQPQFGRLTCEEKLSQTYTDHGQEERRNEDDGGKAYNAELSTAMQHFQATMKTLKDDLKRKSRDVDRTAVDVINDQINSNPIEKKTLHGIQDPMTNIQNTKVPRKSRWTNQNIDKSRPTSYLTIQEVETCASKKRDQDLNFKVDRKFLKHIITSLDDRSTKPTTTEDIKNIDKLLENVPEGQEIYVAMNIHISDKDTQRQTRGRNRLLSTISSYSEMSDRSYVTANFPSHLNDDDYMDMTGKRGSVTKVIIEKEFNMPDGKNNGTQSSFKIGSKTYYDHDLNPRIERIYCSVPDVSEKTKPKYQYVVEELLKTEYNYLMGLHHIYQDYILYFRKNPTKRMIHMQVLFGMIEDLYKLQNTFYNCLNEHVSNVEDLAKCFIENEKLFYLYENYILTMNITKKTLECIECQGDITNRQRELGTPLSFQNYLLTPLQRLTRYVLLLEKLNFELNAEGYECDKLRNVMDFLKTLVESTNVDIEVIQSIKNVPDNITRFGRFIMKDVFNLKKKYSPMKSMVFLFQEVVIFTVETDSMTYMYKGSVSMHSVYIRAIAEKPLCFELLDFNNCSGPNFTFQDKMNSQYQKNLFSLEAQNPKIKDVWVEVIESLLWEQLMLHKKNSPDRAVVRERLV